MSSKERTLQAIRDLPEDAIMDLIAQRIEFLAAVEKARQEVRRGEVVSHEEVQRLLAQWAAE